MNLSANQKGALFMALAMASFTINDAFVKAVTADMNAGQIIFVRGLVSSLLIAAFAWPARSLLRRRDLLAPKVVMRSVTEIGAALTYVMAVGELPLANTASILLALPLAVTLGAAVFLGEQVGWRRWLAIFTGFAGVLIVIRPGPDGFSLGAIYVIGTVFFTTIRDLITRRIDASVPTLPITIVTVVAITTFGGLAIVPLGGWQPLDMRMALHLAAAAAFLVIGYQCAVIAIRSGEIGFVAPFRYTSLIWAIGISILFFGEIPDSWMSVGVAVIVTSGLYAFYRENRRGRAPPAQAAATETP